MAVFKERKNCTPKTEGGRKKESAGREGERKGWKIRRGEMEGDIRETGRVEMYTKYITYTVKIY